MSVPVEPVEARLARLEAPVKHEFCRLASERVPFAAAVTSAAGAAPADAPQPTERKSKNAMKRERAAAKRAGPIPLCSAFVRGTCDRGTSCKYSHDVNAYFDSKPADLPGVCPLAAAAGAGGCTYGFTCRWAGSHNPPHPELQRYMEAKAAAAAAAAAEEKEEENGAPVADTPAAAVTTDAPASAPADPPAAEANNGWWRLDGSIPTAPLGFPPAAPLQPTLNILDKGVQAAVRAGTYDYSVADSAMEQLGINNKTKARDKGGKGGQGGGKGQTGGSGGSGGAGNPEAAEPDAKRARVDSESDAAFLAGATAAPDAQTGHQTSSKPSEATKPSEDYVETRLQARERRSIDFKGKTFLAPLTTVGNLPFRRLAKSLGADVTCGEMALATNLLQGQQSEWALLKRHPDEDCFGVQICGGFGDAMTRCAQLIEDTCQVDFVDVNFGCPIDVVINKGAGSAVLQRPRRMQDIVKGMASVLSCPLTLKMRKGYADGEDVAHTLIPQVASWGASAVTLHGRTREQRYSRLADWPYIKKCAGVAADAGIQLVGNGDVMSWQQHVAAVEDAGVATTYVARGALIKPWVFTEIKEQRDWDISATERLDVIRRFACFGLEHWGSDDRGVANTRRFLLEWLSFTSRYVPVGLLEVLPQATNHRPPAFVGRSDLETLLASPDPRDWIRISEMVLGPAPAGFVFNPKHKATSYSAPGGRDGGGGGRGRGGKQKQEEEF